MMKSWKNFAALFITCISIAGQASALDITDGVQDQINQNDSVSNGFNLGNGVGSTQNLATGNTAATTPANGNSGGGDITGSSSPAVSALAQVCQTPVVSDDGQLHVFSVGVKCFENVVDGMAESTIIKFSDYMRNIVYTALILYLILFGSKVSLGMNAGEKAKSEFFIHALKIAFVAWLVFSFGLLQIYNLVLGTYYSLIDIVLAGADMGTCKGAGGSTVGGTGGIGSTGGTTKIWASIDCMLTEFVGWEAQNGHGTKYKNVPLFFGIIFSKLLPANGMIVGGILFSALWALVSGFFRLAFIYILSMIALILLFSIAPMIIPLLLFKSTFKYFEGWTKLIVSMILQPMILFAFFGFVASLMSTTIDQMKTLYSQMKGSYQTSGSTVTGDDTQIHQTWDAFGNTLANLDAKVLVNGITTLIIAYLLISFINYVSKMAVELAGHGTAPDLGTLSQDMVSFR